MNEPIEEYQIIQKASLQNLPALRNFIERFCRHTAIKDDARFDLKLAVDEACTNIITYGFENIEPGFIKMTLHQYTDRIVVTIIDNGRRFDPEEVSTPDIDAHWKHRNIGGLGLFLIKELVDEMRYQGNSEKGNRMVLTKRLSSKPK